MLPLCFKVVGWGECRGEVGKEPRSRVGPRAALEYVVEIGANRQSCEPSIRLLFKLVLEVVLGVVGADRRA